MKIESNRSRKHIEINYLANFVLLLDKQECEFILFNYAVYVFGLNLLTYLTGLYSC